MRPLYLFLFCLACSLCAKNIVAQAPVGKGFQPRVHRILFLLDASGSMREQWQGESKYVIACRLLSQLADSIERNNRQVEFAVRVFGAQFPKAQQNCKDSRLYIPFTKNNASNFKRILPKLTAQGMTPIAYSIAQGANDFPVDSNAVNALILITDGNESCMGNPCDATKILMEQRISLKPFIVGMQVAEKDVERFNCVGTFLNTHSAAALKHTVGIIISQTLNSTTAQLNLLAPNGEASVTNLPFTFYDHFSRKPIYNFIHTLRGNNMPDTLYLNPVGIYDLEVHSTPSIRVENIQLSVGRHNIIAADVPMGYMKVTTPTSVPNKKEIPVLCRASNEIVLQQNRNEGRELLTAQYRVQALTLPVHDTLLQVTPSQNNEWKIPAAGSLLLTSRERVRASLLHESEIATQIWRGEISGSGHNYKLQPGRYTLVYQVLTSTKTNATEHLNIVIEEGKTVVLDL